MTRRLALTRLLLGGSLLVLSSVPAPAAGGDAAALRAKVRAWRSAHEVEIVRELAGLLSRPNVAGDTENIEKSAAEVVSLLEKRGIRPELLRVPGAPPVVLRPK